MDDLWKGVSDALLKIFTTPLVLFGSLSIHGCMYFTKQMTGGLKKTKYHNQIYTLLPLVFGILFMETTPYFADMLKMSFSQPQKILLGIGLGLLNIMIYKCIKALEKRNKKND